MEKYALTIAKGRETDWNYSNTATVIQLSDTWAVEMRRPLDGMALF